jgi:hypothetical protein
MRLGKILLPATLGAVALLAYVPSTASTADLNRESGPIGSSPKLDKTAARNAAGRKARRFARRHPVLDSASLRRCARRSRHRVLCRFVARGRTRTQRMTCRLRIVVRGEGVDASARIGGVRCQTHSLTVLSRSDARRAMKAAAREVAGAEVAVYALSRLGPRSFSGQAEWTRISPAGTVELCSLELIAEQPPARPVRVDTQGLDCRET